MHYQVVEKPVEMVIGISCRTHNDTASLDIPKLRDRFFNEGFFAKIPNAISQEIITLYYDYEGDHTKPYSYLIGCKTSSLDNIPADMVGVRIPESQFAVFQPKGPFPASIVNTWIAVWNMNLNRSYSVDYELYQANFNPDTAEGAALFIGIK